MNTILLIVSSVALVVVAQVVLKIGASSLAGLDRRDLQRPFSLAWRIVRIPGVVLGLALYAASSLLWIFVLARTPLSYAYPFLGLSYVGVAIVSVAFLRERFSTLQWIGLALVVAGVIAVATSA